MNHIIELLKDKNYIVDLLNGPCIPKDLKNEGTPINSERIDAEASCAVTEAFHKLLPGGIPYLNTIVVERNPDTLYEGTCVDDNETRLRYIVVSVIPDTEFPFDYSYPLIHEMWMVGLHCWELTRAALAACTKEMQVLLAKNPVPPILNNARLEWVSLYLGRLPYQGISRLSEQWAESEDFDGVDADVHLYKVREMECTPLLQRLIDAYDKDYPEAAHEEASPDDPTEVSAYLRSLRTHGGPDAGRGV